jgi:hypothetical protein
MIKGLSGLQGSASYSSSRDVVHMIGTKDNFSIISKAIRLATMVLLSTSFVPAFAQTAPAGEFKFVNVADNSEGFTSFATFPSINRRGAVAFEAMGGAFGDGVFKWQGGALTPVSTTGSNGLTLFNIDPAINDAGEVAYEANLTPLTRGIFTSDGISTKTVVNTTEEGLIGRFIGSPSINNSGDVAFSGVRNGFASQAIFLGDGGPLTIVSDTLNSNFTAFQNTAINAAGEVTFVADSTDRSTGFFVVSTTKDEYGRTATR